MKRNGRTCVLLAGVMAAACSVERAPSVPDPLAAPGMPAAEVAAAPNSPPSIAGDEVCIGPEGADHVFPLELTDPDGDPIDWRAETVEPQGTLSPRSGASLPSGTLVHLVYRPPAGKDRNVIVVTAEDGRGGTTTKRLLARSG